MADNSWLYNIINSQSSGGLNPNVIGATAGGLSRTDLSALLSPQIGVGSGVVNQDALINALEQFYSEQYMQAANKYTEDLASAEQDYKKQYESIIAKYDVPLPITMTSDDPYGIKQNFSVQKVGQVPAALIESMFRDVESGVPLDTVIANAREAGQITMLETQGISPEAVKSALDAWADFSTDRSRDAVKYEYDVQQAESKKNSELARLGEFSYQDFVAPSETQSKFDLYKSLGLEGLALLPDPRETYDIPASAIAEQRGTADTLAARMVAGGRSAPSGPTLVEPSRPQRGNLSQAPSGMSADALQRYQDAAEQQKYEQLRSRIAQSNDPMGRAQRISDYQDLENARIAQLMGQGLAVRGMSPYQDAMNKLLTYGMYEANA